MMTKRQFAAIAFAVSAGCGDNTAALQPDASDVVATPDG